MQLNEAKQILNSLMNHSYLDNDEKEAIKIALKCMERIEHEKTIKKIENNPYIKLEKYLKERGNKFAVSEILMGYEKMQSNISIKREIRNCRR